MDVSSHIPHSVLSAADPSANNAQPGDPMTSFHTSKAGEASQALAATSLTHSSVLPATMPFSDDADPTSRNFVPTR